MSDRNHYKCNTEGCKYQNWTVIYAEEPEGPLECNECHQKYFLISEDVSEAVNLYDMLTKPPVHIPNE